MSLTREEFEASLKSIFYGLAFPNNTMAFQQAFVTNDKSDIDGLAIDYLRAIERIEFYLDEWDSAPDQATKDAVVGSVIGDLGSASVDPEDAYNWPPANGHFGDVKGPINLDPFNKSYYVQVDGTSVGNTSITTIPSGKKFIPQSGGFTLIGVSGLSLVATISIGTNSPNYNNIIGTTLLTGLSVQNQHLKINLSGIITTIAASSEIFCRVSIASTATAYNVIANISGFLIDE